MRQLTGPRRLLGLAPVVLALLGTGTSSWAADPGVTATSIKIGAYNAITGPIPLTGKQMQIGWQTAVNAINDAGGINRRKLQLLVEDDQYEPSRALAAVRKLVERDQVFVMTGTGTPTSVVVARHLDRAKVPLLFPMGASSTQLNQAGLHYLFMIHPAYITQAEVINTWVMANTGVKKPCIIYQLDPAGEDHLAGFRKALEKNKVALTAAEPVERGTTEFSAPALKAKNAGCDMLYTATPLEAAARIATAADRLGWRPKFAGFTTQADATLIKLLGPLAEGFYAADILLRPTSDAPAMKEYLARLKKYFPDATPTFFSTYAYTAMQVIAEALKQAGSPPTRDRLIAVMEAWQNFDTGLMGPISFDPKNHDGKRSLYMIQVKGGDWQQVSDWIGER
jgi:ABC-type branched-subunit amino acid transport system substrate-binding protein